MRKPSLVILSFVYIYLSVSAFFLLGGPVKTIWSFSSFGEDDYFFRVSDIEVDHQRSLIYVADVGNHRILVFDLQGKFQRIIGSEGQGPGEFSNPTGIDILEEGGLAVADFGSNRIQIKPIVPKLLQQRELKEGVISMAATMDLITRDAEIGHDGHLYLLTHKDSFSERIKGKDAKDLGRLLPPPMRIDVIDTDTHKVIRHIECDPGAMAFAVIDKDRLVYIYEDSEGELIFKCIQY